MPIQYPPTFPFFEVPAVARSAYPLLDPFIAPLTQGQASRNYTNFSKAPSLGGIIDGIGSGHLVEIGIQPQGFSSATYLTHQDVYAYLATMGKRYVPQRSPINDKDAEKNAFEAASAFGQQLGTNSLPLPACDEAFSKYPLYLRTVFSSVWVENLEPDGIPYVLDQLWIVERARGEKDPRSFYLLGVEIDGSTKWDRDLACQFRDNLTKQTVRSEYLLKQRIGLYRIGANHMNNDTKREDHMTQMRSLAGRLCEYETLRRSEIFPHIVTAAFVAPDYRQVLASKKP